MSETAASDIQTGPTAVDRLNNGPLNLEGLQTIRKAIFSDPSERERLQAWLHEQRSYELKTGLCNWVLGRYEKALSCLEKHENSPGVRTLICLSLLAIGKADVVLERLATPGNVEEARVRALALSRLLAKKEDARAETDRLLAEPGILESDAVLNFLRGLIAEIELRNQDAVAEYLQAHEKDPNLMDCSFRLARLLDLMGNDEEAIEIYEAYVAASPSNPAVLMNLGLLYEDNGEYKNAIACFQAVIKVSPNHQRAQLYLEDVQASLSMHYDEDQERREDKFNAILRTPVTDFELSVRSRNCLAKMGIRTLGDLVRKTEPELLSYKNFGETSLLEIQEILDCKSLHLGMTNEELASDTLGTQTNDKSEWEPNDPRSRPISELELSVRSRRIVEMFKLRTIGDLTEKTEAELMACPNFGQTSLNEIRLKLDDAGLSLKA